MARSLLALDSEEADERQPTGAVAPERVRPRGRGRSAGARAAVEQARGREVGARAVAAQAAGPQGRRGDAAAGAARCGGTGELAVVRARAGRRRGVEPQQWGGKGGSCTTTSTEAHRRLAGDGGQVNETCYEMQLY